jgi:mono/diheme cytochrome c family protein
MHIIRILALGILFGSIAHAQGSSDPLEAFRPNTAWTVASTGVVSSTRGAESRHLVTKGDLADSILNMEFSLPRGARATVFIQGRYAVELQGSDKEWRALSVRFRAPRFDEGRNKLQSALILDVRVDGVPIVQNRILEEISPDAPARNENSRGPWTLMVNEGTFAFRQFSLQPADFEQVTLPATSGGATNADALVDFVALGKETFESVGCSACHSVRKSDSAVTSGPNLFGLFKREPRLREVAEGSGGQRFSIRADRGYLHRSLRSPAEQLAIAESGTKKNEPYPALMPPISAEIVSDTQIAAIAAYLSTLNDPYDQGPAMQLQPLAAPENYDPMQDRLQLLVNDEVRIQRGPMGGVSGRAIHVGQPNGIHYSFDPRILGIAKVWQGGFMDRSGEMLDRGGKGLKVGHEGREISLGEHDYVFAPLDATGKVIDFSFKEAKFGDAATVRASLYSEQDHLARLKAMDAQFLGYTRSSREKLETPQFRYRIGKSTVSVQTNIAETGEVEVRIEGKLAAPQSFAINTHLLQDARVSDGQLTEAKWTLPAGRIKASLNAKIALVENTWRPTPSDFDYRHQPLEVAASNAQLPAGYSIESYHPPKDNYGREQLFEALGLALAGDETVFVATRTAGVWRIAKGQWQLFAEGPFDSLGILLGDKKGRSVIVGQKAELTRITDTDGDGIADSYETLFDAHSYHGNYHAYMHGPVLGEDGAYYIAINLAHVNDDSTYKAGGEYMGATGGFSGWSFRVRPNGDFTPWANGLRSPAGISKAPDGRLWYADNQGEFVGTSKLFVLEQGRFYGHPAGLIDLPGMTPDSPLIQWEKVAPSRVRPVVLFPHNRVANSPGHPAWDTTKGKFGAFTGQILIGDQTQSNLLRVATQVVDGVEQGSVMTFMEGLESGVMRPLFLRDGSLLLGQTGRGWQAKGGHVASLQHIRWDGQTVAPAIRQMLATPSGFRLEFTQPLSSDINVEQFRAALQLESWTYRDAPAYGSEELDLRQDAIAEFVISDDRKSVAIDLASLAQSQVHPQQTARVYHAHLATAGLFEGVAPEKMEAYYTLYAFPSGKKGKRN